MANEIDSRSVPGYLLSDMDSFADPRLENWHVENWEHEFQRTLEIIMTFLRVRQPLAVLARSALQQIIESDLYHQKKTPSAHGRLEQGEVEILQALILTQTQRFRNVPTSPKNFSRLWILLDRHIGSFVRKHPPVDEVGSAANYVVTKARIHTIYYRNHFHGKDYEINLLSILSKIDAISENEMEYKLSDAYRMLVRIINIVSDRMDVYKRRVGCLLSSKNRHEVIDSISFFSSLSPLASRLWEWGGHRFVDLESLRMAGFQMSEMSSSWIFTLSAELLEAEFPDRLLKILPNLSIRCGELSTMNLEHIYMNNPVWRRPFIALEDGAIFAPLAQLAISFPFAIIEALIAGKSKVEKAYNDARSEYLEETIAAIMRRALPSAEVYRGVVWTDPVSGTPYENDVVVLIGNTIFLLEAKSGRLADATRRGGILSLKKNFKALFVEPGEQAWRLENYIESYRERAVLRVKSTGAKINLHLDRKKIVFRFSICMEHFSSITSARHYLKELGLINADDAWAPVLGIGELQQIEKLLDTEISFYHYLTRRATIESLIDFEGDEQDLLSMYLTNGFFMDLPKLDGHRIFFKDADLPVRKHSEPRLDRTEFKVHFAKLSPMWLSSLQYCYRNTEMRHRFDVIHTVLNQQPDGLREMERRIRRWRRGKGLDGDDLMFCHSDIGTRRFSVVLHLNNKLPHTDEWHEKAREMAYQMATRPGTTDCVVLLMLRRSKQSGYDALSFFRILQPS